MPDTTPAERPDASRDVEPLALSELPARDAQPSLAPESADAHEDAIKGGRMARDGETTTPTKPIPIPYPNI